MEGTAEGYSYASHSIDERNAMARYDYRCTECGTVFEVEHPMGERPEVACPACGAPCERVFEASAITFTGSGFYNTDSRDRSGTSSESSHSTSCAGCSGGDCSGCH